MSGFKEHVNGPALAAGLVTSRFSRHPERYLEILRIGRKYELHHVAAQFGMGHRHEDEDRGLEHEDADDDHAPDLQLDGFRSLGIEAVAVHSHDVGEMLDAFLRWADLRLMWRGAVA